MARGQSPWGDGAGEGRSPREADDAPPAEAAASSGKSEPANPWLDQPEDPRPRRSAGIDDILRQRPPAFGQFKGNWTLALLAAVFAAWIALTSVHVLDRDERALVLTLGRNTGEFGPGFKLTLPWPLQSLIVGKVDAERVTDLPASDGETLMPTRDGELIDLRVKVRWRVVDLKAYAFNLPEGEAAVRRLADAQVRAAVAELPFAATYDGDMRGQLQLRAAERAQRVLDAWRAGVRIDRIEVVQVAPPARLAETFDKISKAREEARRSRESDAGWRQQELANTRRDMADFDDIYAQYKIAPEATRTNLYYETVEKILRANPVIVGGSSAVNAPPPSPQPEGQ